MVRVRVFFERLLTVGTGLASWFWNEISINSQVPPQHGHGLRALPPLSHRLQRVPPLRTRSSQSAHASDSGVPHHHHKKIITSDPYVKVSVAGATVARTRVIPNSQEPIWDEHFQVTLAHSAASVEFQVKDNDVFGAQLIGTVTVSANHVELTRGSP
ncbi:Phospholipase D delta [Acorus calamus]|uniref:Phospholipase D delta n=1 Tax=Acorus calamus TaxID=4465 RepID=A0AAV9FA66_ACOCL|nr:Phospholipase D delta [Acorus calamus]